MRKILAGLFLAVVVAAGLYYYYSGPKKAETPPAGEDQASGSSVAPSEKHPRPTAPPTPNTVMPEPGSSVPASTQAAPSSALPTGAAPSKPAVLAPESAPSSVADFPQDIVTANVRRAVRQYGDMFDGNPVGTNPEITAALSGQNPKGINFINPEAGMRVNGRGEMVDSWGTPYFFHQISSKEMEVRSAGPDKVMWTTDDVVAK